jgi:L-ascorbate 6-phosphate lactonase
MHPFETLVVPQNHIAIHWFGQNSFALKDPAGAILLVDPYFPHHRPAGEFIHPLPPLDERDLRIDLVLLTPDHLDHTCPETLARIHAAHPAARFLGPRESVQRLAGLSIPAALLTELRAGQSHREGAWSIHAEYSKPPAGAPEDGIPAPDVEHLGCVVELGARRVYISGDLIFTFSKHPELLAPIARHKPEIGLLTNHPTEGEFPDFAGSVEMAVKLGLQAAVPSHYDCFVKRTYDPHLWAAGFPAGGPQPVIIPYNDSILWPG